MNFISRLEDLINKNGITKNKMLKDLNFGTGTFATWESRGTIPNGEMLVKIAEYFNVSVDYLLNVENSPTNELSREHRELIELYDKLNTRGKLKAIEYMSDLSENERYSTEVDMEFHTRNA